LGKEVFMAKGRLFGFDGGDGSGKQTQTKLLLERLLREGNRATSMDFPQYTGTPFGQGIRKALDGEYGDFLNLPPLAASTIYAYDRWAMKRVMNEILANGTSIILDRYVSANQIHQGGKIKNEAERREFLRDLYRLEYETFGVPRPDFMIYLDVPPAVSAELMSKRKRDMVESDERYMRDSYESARWLVATFPEEWLHIHCLRDGILRSPQEIHLEVVNLLKERKVL